MTIICPRCGAKLVEVVLPPDRIVACPNLGAGCGQRWGRHVFPQMLRVKR